MDKKSFVKYKFIFFIEVLTEPPPKVNQLKVRVFVQMKIRSF